MSSANDGQATEPANGSLRETMTIGDAAALLRMPVARVRRLCNFYERNPAEGLAFEWTSSWVPRTDISGYKLRGHRRPYRDAVEALATAKQRAERNPSL